MDGVADGVGHFRALESEFEIGFDEACGVADVVSGAVELDPEHGFAGDEEPHGVGELDFAAEAFGGGGEAFEDGRGEDVAAGDGHAAGCGFARGFFDPLVDPPCAVTDGGGVGDAVAGDLVFGYLFEGYGGAAVGVEGGAELSGDWVGGVRACDDGVAEEDGAGVIACEGAAEEDGVAEAEHFLLPCEVEPGALVRGGDDGEF